MPSREKFCLGIDYGTESGRVVVIRVRDGREMGAAIVPYADGVIDKKLPGGPQLEADWAAALGEEYQAPTALASSAGIFSCNAGFNCSLTSLVGESAICSVLVPGPVEFRAHFPQDNCGRRNRGWL